MQMGPAHIRRIPKTTESEYDSDPIEWEPRRARRWVSPPRQLTPPSARANWQQLVERARLCRRIKHRSREDLRQ